MVLMFFIHIREKLSHKVRKSKRSSNITLGLPLPLPEHVYSVLTNALGNGALCLVYDSTPSL